LFAIVDTERVEEEGMEEDELNVMDRMDRMDSMS
jgi:hypothetical protein